MGTLMAVFLPVVLAVIMFGLGLSLTAADFKRVLVFPKAIVVALVCQGLLLPAICFMLVKVFGLAPELAIGLMVLAASPGGTSANLYSHLARGDVALNVTLTAVNSAVSIVSLPAIVNLSVALLAASTVAIPLQFDKVVQVFSVVLVPVLLGMWIRYKAPDFARRADFPVRVASVLFLLAALVLVALANGRNALVYLPQAGAAALAFNLISLAIGYSVPRFLRLNHRQSIAISMEIGIHNSALAITICVSPLLLNNPTMAIPIVIYTFIAYATAAIFCWLANRGQKFLDRSLSAAGIS